MLRLIRWMSVLLIAVLLIGWGFVWLAGRDPGGLASTVVNSVRSLAGGPPAPGGGTDNLAGLRLGGPFTLVDQHGATVTDSAFRGRWMLVYFGYTYCPDVCPTELQAISAALDRLGPDAAKIVPIFITIDPDRDTPTILGDYVKLFDDRFIALTGSSQQIHDIAQLYRVYYAKVTTKGATDYLMDHSSFMYLMGPDGAFRTLLRPGGTPAELADAIKARIRP